MTYRAWEQKPLDRTAVRELTAAIAEQAAAQLEEQAMDEAPWSDEKYKAVLAAQQKENALLAGILAARGITDPAEALTLLAGEEELSDPALLTDMDAACQRIWQAIDNGETIAVFGDYDVDGVTATALLYQHLKGMGATVKCMLPSREGDGYGLSKNAIQSMHNKGCTLIVTVDCGVTNLEEKAYAAQRGVDIVLLDVLLPDGDGLAHVETFSQLPGRPDVVIITGHGNADAAEAALRSGAWEYLVKPLRVRDLSKALTQAVQWRNSRDSQSRSLLRHPDIIGKSPALAEALEALREAAASNVNVLITGETAGQGGPYGQHRACNRRIRNWQGVAGPRPARQQPAGVRPVRHRRLYHLARNAGGGASVRTRPGRVHRSRQGARGSSRRRRPRHAVP